MLTNTEDNRFLCYFENQTWASISARKTTNTKYSAVTIYKKEKEVYIETKLKSVEHLHSERRQGAAWEMLSKLYNKRENLPLTRIWGDTGLSKKLHEDWTGEIIFKTCYAKNKITLWMIEVYNRKYQISFGDRHRLFHHGETLLLS